MKIEYDVYIINYDYTVGDRLVEKRVAVIANDEDEAVAEADSWAPVSPINITSIEKISNWSADALMSEAVWDSIAEGAYDSVRKNIIDSL